MIVNMMRSNQRWLMIIISVLVIISFIYFYSNQTRLDRSQSDTVGKIYGRNLSSIDFDRTKRQARTAGDLFLMNLYQVGVFNPSDPDAGALNLLVLQHEAQALGIDPSQAEVDATIEKLPAFQAPNGGGFDEMRFEQFVTDKLGPRGFGRQQISELIRADLQVGKLRDLLEGTVNVTPAEVRTAYNQIYTRTAASVIRLKTADLAAAAEPTEPEIKKYYDEQKDHFQFPEKRKVQYVAFGVDDTQKTLTGKELLDARGPSKTLTEQFLNKLYDAKDQIADVMKAYDPKKIDAKEYDAKLREAQAKFGFAAVAAELKTPIRETPEFEEINVSALPEANVPQFVQTAFHLTPGEPDSDVIDASTAYYVLHLSDTVPSKPMTLDEARPKIVTAIKADRAKATLTAKAEEIRTKLNEALKAGKSIADAAKDAGQTVEEIPTFSVASLNKQPPTNVPDFSIIAENSLDVDTNALGKFVPTPEGGLFIFLRGRGGIDEKEFDQQKDSLVRNLRTQKRQFFFREWLRSSIEAANVKFSEMSLSQG